MGLRWTSVTRVFSEREVSCRLAMVEVSCGRPLVAKSLVGPSSLPIMVRASRAVDFISWAASARLVRVRLASPSTSCLLELLSSVMELAVLSMSCSAFWASARMALRSRASSATDLRSCSRAPAAEMLSSDRILLTRSSASTARCITVPPPSSRSARVLFWLWITGILPAGVTSLSRGLAGVPPVSWM